eukprot:54896-Eustigmatos_ZCMA.PRE.1
MCGAIRVLSDCSAPWAQEGLSTWGEKCNRPAGYKYLCDLAGKDEESVRRLPWLIQNIITTRCLICHRKEVDVGGRGMGGEQERVQ